MRGIANLKISNSSTGHKKKQKDMIEKLTDWLIERRLKKLHIPVVMGSASDSELQFRRVLNTLRENKIMVDTREDGIYIRMAGTESKGECFTYEWAKVKSF